MQVFPLGTFNDYILSNEIKIYPNVVRFNTDQKALKLMTILQITQKF